MINGGHLWAAGYDDMERAEQVRAEIIRLGDKRSLLLDCTAVAVRFPDGSFTVDGEPFVAAIKLGRHGLASFLAALALGAPPLTGPAVDGLSRNTGGLAAGAGFDKDFVCEVEKLMKPGTSVLFVLDHEGDMAAILEGIRGLGGTVLKTNVDVQRAELIQSTLADAAAEPEVRP